MALAFVLLAATAAVALVLASDPGPKRPAPPGGSVPLTRPLRVSSGSQIATGFGVGGDRVVTVAHALGEDVSVDGHRARVVRLDRQSDLALLAVRGLATSGLDFGGTPAIAADSGRDGARLRLLRLRSGRGSALAVRVRRAIIAHVRAAGAHGTVTRPALELAGRVEPGDSGAPVVSRSGAVAGVVFAGSSRRSRTAYATDASAVARLLARD